MWLCKYLNKPGQHYVPVVKELEMLTLWTTEIEQLRTFSMNWASRSISPVIIHETMRGRIIILSILMSISPGKAISRMASLEGSAARSAIPRIIPAKTPPMVRTNNKFSLPQAWHCRNKMWTVIASMKTITGLKVLRL